MDRPTVDSFFKITSRLVIIFPILVIVTAFFLWNPSQKKQQEQPVPTQQVGEPTTVTTQIDISGSYACSFRTEKDATVSAYIKNKALYVQNRDLKKTTYVLFQKDCLYEWQENVALGQMTCGLSQYVSMFENMSKLGLANPDTYLKTFLGDTGKIKDEKGKATTLGKACQKKEIKNTKIFEVPKTVQFIKKKSG
jgi:preprotein translocase subunit YajC